MPPDPPTVAAATLQRLRHAAGLTVAAAARHSGVERTRIHKIETGQIVPNLAQVDALTDTYNADPDDRALLRGHARENDTEHRRVATWRPRAARVQREYAHLETASHHIVTFHPTVIPGLLQTDAYAAAIAHGAGADPDTLDQWLQARRARRAILDQPGRRFTQIIGPGALLWWLGGTDVMTAQLEALDGHSRRSNIELGIIPPGVELDVHVLNGFDLYERGGQPPRVIVGTHAAVQILDEPDDVAIYTALLDRLQGLAVRGQAARAVLAAARDRSL